MTVAIAAKVFGSEVTVGLIRHYRLHAGSQTDAAHALDLPTQVISRATRTLVEAGVVVRGPGAGRGRQAGRYIVDDHRVRFLLDELRRYCDPPQPPEAS